MINCDVQNDIMEMRPTMDRIATIQHMLSTAQRDLGIDGEIDDLIGLIRKSKDRFSPCFSLGRNLGVYEAKKALKERHGRIPKKETKINQTKTDAEDEKDTGVDMPQRWFFCDVIQLLTLLALSKDSAASTVLGSPKSLKETEIKDNAGGLFWATSLLLSKRVLPPNDEGLVVLLVQNALSACFEQHISGCDKCNRTNSTCNCDPRPVLYARAQKYAQAALEMHNVVFGGGLERFRLRYQREWGLMLRGSSVVDTKSDNVELFDGKAVADVLWPSAP